MCPYTARYVSLYCYISSVLIMLYICPQTAIHVSLGALDAQAYVSIRQHTSAYAIYMSSCALDAQELFAEIEVMAMQLPVC